MAKKVGIRHLCRKPNAPKNALGVVGDLVLVDALHMSFAKLVQV